MSDTTSGSALPSEDARAGGNQSLLTHEGYEYGLLGVATTYWREDDPAAPVDVTNVVRVGLTEQEAHSWVADWKEMGGEPPDAFSVIRRRVSDWERVS